MLATTGAKQVGSRRAFERILETGRIFFVESDRDWILDGASVRICMVAWTGKEGAEPTILDGATVERVNADLSAGSDLTAKVLLCANADRCFMGTTKVGAFDIEQETALSFLAQPNPHGKPNSDVVRPLRNGSDIVRQNSHRWIVDFGVATAEQGAALYEAPFRYVVDFVKPERMKNTDPARVKYWWLFARARPDFRAATANSSRYLATARVAKHRLFVWLDSVILPDSKVIAIAFDDDFHFGVLHSRIHELWTLATCAWHGVGNDATYNPTECFETFPFPDTSAEQRAGIADAAEEMNALRESWLNPPEWTTPRTLTFPGALDGPWRRFVRDADAHGIGTVHYPLTEPRDAECAAKIAKRTLTNLYNERPAWLANAHAKIDAAVAAAYGWPADLSDDEILSRLLTLNLARATAEQCAAAIATAKKRVARERTEEEML